MPEVSFEAVAKGTSKKKKSISGYNIVVKFSRSQEMSNHINSVKMCFFGLKNIIEPICFFQYKLNYMRLWEAECSPTSIKSEQLLSPARLLIIEKQIVSWIYEPLKKKATILRFLSVNIYQRWLEID